MEREPVGVGIDRTIATRAIASRPIHADVIAIILQPGSRRLDEDADLLLAGRLEERVGCGLGVEQPLGRSP